MKFLSSTLFLLLGLVSSAFAAPPDFTPLTSAIDISTVITAVLAVAVIGIGFILASRGATTVMAFIKRALNG